VAELTCCALDRPTQTSDRRLALDVSGMMPVWAGHHTNLVMWWCYHEFDGRIFTDVMYS